ncbi:hypothetical protein [Pseudorhodobacter sp.]|uniref:hypothetical protein n=1 Tax=Pseudorhodobacter sp. TaxID=1934400 RepID=UPI002647D65E|nr:hypothetical protein [Pseudorhodobacter sp.]MDN5786718.1 hypothetical protein [Pseudorhodobacter sp.]
MRWLLALVCWFCTATAYAGAWPRQAGQVFIAVSTDQTRSQIYAEYGLRGDWTMGMEVSMPRGRRLPDLTSFIQRPVWRGAGGSILSVGLSMEMREARAAAVFPLLKGETEVAARVGLIWGKGFVTGWGEGWFAAEAQVERLVTNDWLRAGLAYKLDLAFGLKPHDRLMVMAQAQAWQQANTRTLRLEPGVAWRFGRGHLVLSPSVGVVGPKAPRMKLAVWTEF